MATTRINPLHDLKQTAAELATFILNGDKQLLEECLNEAKQIYQQPLQSWVTSIFYLLLGSRTRGVTIDNAILAIRNGEDESSHSKQVKDIFQHGGWEETSFNTTLLRILVRHLINYDTTVELPLSVVIELKVLLLFAQAKLMNDEMLLMQQQAIQKLEYKKQLMVKQLTEYEDKLSEYKVMHSELSKEREEIETEIDLYKESIEELDREKLRLKDELTRIEFMSLDPDMDINKLTEEQLVEAKKIASTAVRMYIKDLAEMDVKRQELKTLRKTKSTSLAQSKLASHAVFFQKDAAARAEELAAIPEIDQSTKLKVASILAGKSNATAVPTRNSVASRISTHQTILPMMEMNTLAQKKKTLYSKGQIAELKQDLTQVAIVLDYEPESTAPKSVVTNDHFKKSKNVIATLFGAHVMNTKNLASTAGVASDVSAVNTVNAANAASAPIPVTSVVDASSAASSPVADVCMPATAIVLDEELGGEMNVARVKR